MYVPVKVDKRLKKPAHTRLNALSVALMLKALLEGPTSVAELIEISGLSSNTIRAYVSMLLKKKCVHISGWDKDDSGKPSIRILSLGHGKSVDRPRKNKALVARECRARKKAKKLAEAMNNVVSFYK